MCVCVWGAVENLCLFMTILIIIYSADSLRKTCFVKVAISYIPSMYIRAHVHHRKTAM